MRSRKWFITIWNEVQDKNTNEIIKLNLEEIIDQLLKKYTLLYIKHNKEENEKEHLHIYINNKNAIEFNALRNINKYFHIEQVKGNDNQIYNYMLHKDSKSIENNKPQYDTTDIKGNYNIDLQQKNEIGINLIKDIESNMTLWEIIQNNPNLWQSIDKIQKLYEIYQLDKQKRPIKFDENGEIFEEWKE